MRTHPLRHLPTATFLLVACLLLVSSAQNAVAGGPTIIVDETADELNADGDCSLREAIKATRENAAVDACPAGHPLGPDTIVVESGTTYTLTIEGDGDDEGDLDTGGEAANPLFMRSDPGPQNAIIDANGIDRVIEIANGGEVTIMDIDFTNGSTDEGGGAVNNLGTLSLTNVAVTDSTSGFAGGGIRSGLGDQLMLTDVLISGNVAESSGGGIESGSNLRIDGSVITENMVTDGTGGGISSGGLVEVPGSGIVLIINTTISGNEASTSGGGIKNTGPLVTIKKSAITGNIAGTEGGGIENGATSTDEVVNLTNVTISGNSAPAVGGFNDEGDAGSSLLNVTIANNVATNPANPSSFRVFPGQATIQNTIVVGDTSNTCFGDIVSLGNNLENGDDCNFDPAMDDIINADPLLGPLQNNGGDTDTHALLAGSPALSAADGPSCPDDDQRGAPRPQGDGCDIGAYESSFNAPPPTPTPASTPSPSPAPSPSPTPPPGPALIQGDNDCDTTNEEDPDVDAVDALIGLQFVAALPYNQQPDCVPIGNNLAPAVLPAGQPPDHFGDIDCDLDVDAVDALQILRFVAGLSVSQDEPCTDIGDPF